MSRSRKNRKRRVHKWIVKRGGRVPTTLTELHFRRLSMDRRPAIVREAIHAAATQSLVHFIKNLPRIA